jgi:biopolymer transport protein ExbD
MIDMTFQLIAFFMFVLNFGEGQQDARINLPHSELAKPPERATETFVVLQLSSKDTVIVGGGEYQLSDLPRLMAAEAEQIRKRKKTPADAVVFIRADAKAKTGLVQEMISKCQEQQFEKFGLRAKSQRL